MKTDDDVVYRLHDGLVLESAPQKKDVEWPQHAMLKIDTKSEGNTLDVRRSMAYNYVLLAPEAYSELHDFYRKIAAGDQQQVVLKRSAESAGQ